MLDLFDLDEHFTSEKARLAQITNKCKRAIALSATNDNNKTVTHGPQDSSLFGKCYNFKGKNKEKVTILLIAKEFFP